MGSVTWFEPRGRRKMQESKTNKSSFLAIDFETANYSPDSACSVGLVRVENDQIIDTVSRLIRPPTSHFVFTYIHGLTWNDVAKAPTFGELWSEIKYIFEGIECIVAHNVSFDKKVLNACCETYNVELPKMSYGCSMKIARNELGIYPTKLSDVCRQLKIKLNHHEALSDALACAQIILHSRKLKNHFSSTTRSIQSNKFSVNTRGL